MPFLSKMLHLWQNLFQRRRVEGDLHDELQSYLEEQVERKIQEGLSPEAARSTVLLEFGCIDTLTQLVREQRVGYGRLRVTLALAGIAFVAFLSGAWSALSLRPPVGTGPHSPLTWTKQADHPTDVILQGRIVDANGQPIPHAEVGLEPAPLIRRYTYSDDKGFFTFLNPPPLYRLTAGKKSWNVGVRQPVTRSTPESSSPQFTLATPSSVHVLSRNGAQMDGELLSFSGVAFATKKPATFEFRQFDYATGILELQANN